MKSKSSADTKTTPLDTFLSIKTFSLKRGQTTSMSRQHKSNVALLQTFYIIMFLKLLIFWRIKTRWPHIKNQISKIWSGIFQRSTPKICIKTYTNNLLGTTTTTNLSKWPPVKCHRRSFVAVAFQSKTSQTRPVLPCKRTMDRTLTSRLSQGITLQQCVGYGLRLCTRLNSLSEFQNLWVSMSHSLIQIYKHTTHV